MSLVLAYLAIFYFKYYVGCILELLVFICVFLRVWPLEYKSDLREERTEIPNGQK